MNAIDLVTPNVGLVFWTTMLFLAVLIVLRKYAWGPIMQGLEQREKTIADDLRRAEEARVAAEQARDDLLKEQAKHLQETNDRIVQMMRNAESRSLELVEKAKGEAVKIRDAALADIELERQQAIASLRNEVVSIAIMAASNVIGRELKPEDHRLLIENSIPKLN